jgi:hypothetical protein
LTNRVIPKFKNYCTAKETITRIKRQPTEGEKILTSYACDMVLISRIYKEFKKMKHKKKNNPINRWSNELNRHFSKEVQMVNEHIKNVQQL